MFCFDVPAPILLIRLNYLYIPFDELATKPGGNVLAETAGIYEVIFHLREVKSIRLEQKIMAHTASFRKRSLLFELQLKARFPMSRVEYPGLLLEVRGGS